MFKFRNKNTQIVVSRWRYILAAVVPTMLIGLILSYLLSTIMDEIEANNLARSELSSMASLHNAAIDLQKIRGLEQIVLGNNTEQPEIAGIEKLHQAILDVQKIRGLEQIQIITPHLAERVTGLRHDFVILIDELIAVFGKQDNNARQVLEEVRQETRILFSNRIAEHSLHYRFEQYTYIISSLHSVMLTESLNLYHLMHHDNLNSAYLIELYGLDIPYLIESIGRVRGYGSGLLGRNDVTPEEKQKWTELIGGVREALERIEKKIKIIQLVAGGRNLFEDEHIIYARQQVREYVRYALVFINRPSRLVSAPEYFDNGTLAIEHCLLIYDALQNNISMLLVRRRQELNSQFFNLTIGSALVVMLLLYFTATFYRNMRCAFYKIKEVNDGLSESDARLREIVDLLPVMVAARDSSGKVLLENKAYRRVVYPENTKDSQGEKQTIENNELFADDGKVLAKKILISEKEIEFIDKDDNKRILKVNKIPYNSSDNSEDVVLTVALDVTDSKRVHELQRVAGVGYWEWDLEAGRLYFSDEFYSVIGWHKDDFGGNIDSLLKIVVEEDKHCLANAFEQVRDSGKGFEIEVGIKCNGMNMRHVRMQSHSYQRVSDGSQVMVGAVHDITFEKNTMHVLRDSEEKYRQLVESLRDEYFFYSFDAVGKMTYMSPSICNVLGYSAEEFIGRTNISSRISTFMENEKNTKYKRPSVISANEISIYDSAGIEHFLELSEVPVFDGRGELTAIEGIAHDITARKSVETELRESEHKLRDLALHLQQVREAERTTIARDIHDDIGGMLAALKMDTNLLSSRLKHTDTEEEVYLRLDKMTQHLDMLMQTVRRIISNLRPSVLDNLGLLEAIEWQLSELQDNCGIECHYDRYLEEEQLEFASDGKNATSIFRITQELMTNIIRHSDASVVTVLVAIIDDDFVFSISDNGCGMDVKLRPRADSFGLIGVKERIRSMAGKISIISKKDIGTTVTMHVPVAVRGK